MMYEELVENLKSLRENYFQTQDDDNFCFSAVDADMLESAAEVIEDLELVSRSQQAACNQLAEAIEKLQSELEHLKNCRHECKIDCLLKEYNKKCNELEQVKAERDTFLKEKAEREKGCDFCNAEYAVMSGSRMNSDLIHKGCAAKFCPNCGKRLVSEE